MTNSCLGYSTFLTDFPQQKETLARVAKADPGQPLIFVSLHVFEEVGPGYQEQMTAMCHWLNDQGFRIIADLSPRTPDYFACQDLTVLAENLGLWALRPDYGFSWSEILYFASKFPLVVNATTSPADKVSDLLARGAELYAMHNYYPRPETGLDHQFFVSLNQELRQLGLKIMAFIPGDIRAEKPLGLGLPSLEQQRDYPSSVAYLEMALRYGVDHCFIGDAGLYPAELDRILEFNQTGIINLPVHLDPAYIKLLGQVFTHRNDSPSQMIRLAESREYAVPGQTTPVAKTGPRPRGSITIDNLNYARYSGEIQLMRSDLAADERVNLIGRVDPAYLPLLDCILRGAKFRFEPTLN